MSTDSCFAALTLKERVAWFWEWFSASAERFYETIEEHHCVDLQPETSQAVERWLPNMAWVYGPGRNKDDHSLTLSGEGCLPKQFVAEYWQSQAPSLKGWTFHASRQPTSSFDGVVLRLEKELETFKPIEFWVCPHLDEEAEKIDITVWHPSFQKAPEKARLMALFLMLDELLGEHGTQNWIGSIQFGADHLRRSVPIVELREMIHEAQNERGWKKYAPTETYTSYRLKEQRQEWPRGDTVAGSSRLFELVGGYMRANGPCDHPLPGLGVDLVFVSIPTKYFPKGGEVRTRGEIEDGLVSALEAEAAGISLGGATGYQNSYIDLALYDGANSLEIVKRTLKKLGVPQQSGIHYFTSDHARQPLRV